MFTHAKDISFQFHLYPGAVCPFWRWLRILCLIQAPAKKCYCLDNSLGELKGDGKPTERQDNPTVLPAAVICWQEALSGKTSTWKCLQSLWMVFKQDVNGSLTSCQICHILYNKAQKKSHTCRERVPSGSTRKKSWILSNLWHFHSAPGSGLRPHFCTGDFVLPQGRKEKEKERAEMQTGVGRAGYSYGLKGVKGGGWMTAIRILIKFNLPP